MTLADRLDAFDGKHTAPLEALVVSLSPDAGVVPELIRLTRTGAPKRQAGATWVLKRLVEGGHAFTPSETKRLLALLADVTSWEAALHLLQVLPHLIIPAASTEALHRDLAALARDENKFVQAWALSGLYALADQHPAYRDAMRRRLRRALDDGSASARARVRNAVKGSTWFAGE